MGGPPPSVIINVGDRGVGNHSTVIMVGLRWPLSPAERKSRHNLVGRRALLARCDCGAHYLAIVVLFAKGANQTCGCTRKPVERPPIHHVEVGSTFGEWLVLDPEVRKPSKNKRHGKRAALVRCVCGYQTTVPIADLISNRSTSCKYLGHHRGKKEKT